MRTIANRKKFSELTARYCLALPSIYSVPRSVIDRVGFFSFLIPYLSNCVENIVIIVMIII